MKVLFQIVLLLATAMTAIAQTSMTAAQGTQIGAASHIMAPSPNYKPPESEILVYDGEWRLWTAGQAALRVDPGPNGTVKVSATANSTGVVALLYTVRDRFESFFEPKTFCSERIFKHAEEGTHKRDTNIRFDYNTHKSVLDEKNLKTNEVKHTEEDLPGCVTDVLSGIFYVSSLPLTPNASYTFPLNDGGKTVDVKATVEGKEQVKAANGQTYNTIRVRTEANSGPLKKRGSIWFWFTDDNQRIPVQMRARLFWGTLTFRLLRTDKK